MNRLSTHTRRGRQVTIAGLASAVLALGLAAPAAADNAEAFHDDGAPVAQHSRWMTHVPDQTNLIDISIPLTHDSAAFACPGGITFEWCQTQSMNFADQLQSGIRGLDIRIRYRDNGTTASTDDYFSIAHGSADLVGPGGGDMRLDFVLSEVRRFLIANPEETVLFKIGDNGLEDRHDNRPDGLDDSSLSDAEIDALKLTWDQEIRDLIDTYRTDPAFEDYIWTPGDVPAGYTPVDPAAKVPELGMVRGKMVLMPSGPGTGGIRENTTNLARIGLYPVESTGGNARFLTAESFGNHVIVAVDFFHQADDNTDTSTLYLNQLNANGDEGRLGQPDQYAGGATLSPEGINERVVEWMLGLRTIDGTTDNEDGVSVTVNDDAGLSVDKTGVVGMDFPGASLIQAVIAHNFDLMGDPVRFQPDAVQMMPWLAHHIENEVDNNARQRNEAMHKIWSHFLPGEALHAVTAKYASWPRFYDNNGFALLGPEIHDYRHLVYLSDGDEAQVGLRGLRGFLGAKVREMDESSTERSQDQRAKFLYDALQAEFTDHRVSVHSADNLDKLAAIPGRGSRFVTPIAKDKEDYYYVVWLYDGPVTPPNYAPTADIGGPYSTAEGTAVTLDASGSSDPNNDALTYEWDLDEGGTFDDGTGATVSFDDVADDGTQRVSVRVSDGSKTDTASIDVTVVNADPSITSVGVTAGDGQDEGRTIEVAVDYTDAGQLDTHTCTIDWGDGTQDVEPGAGRGAGTCSASHVYADDARYPLVATVEDDDAGDDQQAQNLPVGNLAPTVVAGLDPIDIQEGDTVSGLSATFNDLGTLDTHTATVTWGDGTRDDAVMAESPFGPPGSTAGLTGTIALPDHTYADDLDGQVEVCLSDDEGEDGCATSPVTVRNVAPALQLTGGDQIDEGGIATISGRIGDPGVADTFTADVDWGDGTTEQDVPLTTTVQVNGDRAFTLDHRYADDDPTVTAVDDYAVSVTVTDDDGGVSGTEATTVEVSNVAPVASFDLSADSIEENDTITMSGTVTDASASGARGDSFVVRVEWGDGTDDSEIAIAAGEAREFSVDHQYLDDGTYDVRVTVTDDDTGTHTPATQTVTVGNTDPLVSAPTVAIPATQYSDPFAGNLRFTATDVAGYDRDPETLSAVAAFEGAPLPTTLVLGDPDCSPGGDSSGLVEPRQTCTWTVAGSGEPLLLAPGDYTVRVTVADDDGGRTSAAVDITIAPEDARVTYTGPTVAASPLSPDGTTSVELRATVRDVSVVTDDPATDPWPGDIRFATVDFVDRNNANAVLCSTTVSLMFAGNEQVGSAACDWETTLGDAARVNVDVGIVVGGYYTRDSSADDVEVTVAKPTDRFITGGGYIDYGDPLNSEGVHAADDGSKTNFGFNVKFNKRGTVLKGQSTLLIRSDGRVLQVKVTQFDSLGIVGESPSLAQFEARADVVDRSGRGKPTTVGEDLRLQMRMTDFGQPGDTDTIAWTIYDNDGQLLFSSHWNGASTEETDAAGNLVVHGSP